MSNVQRFAVVGNPIEHSRSPEIHADFAAQLGIPLSYERLLAPLDAFAVTLERFLDAGGHGVNVTVPFKLEAARWVAQLEPAAARVGAVNTIYRDSVGAWVGANTDGDGLVADLRRLGWDPAGANVLLLGAGGAARGALLALLGRGPRRITVANRTPASAISLRNDLLDAANGAALEVLAPSQLTDGYDLIINSTALGLGESEDLGVRAFQTLLPTLACARAHCYDMVYGAARPNGTAFCTFAGGRGAGQLADGLGMLVGQAALAFERWHGQRPELASTLARIRQPARDV